MKTLKAKSRDLIDHCMFCKILVQTGSTFVFDIGHRYSVTVEPTKQNENNLS